MRHLNCFLWLVMVAKDFFNILKHFEAVYQILKTKLWNLPKLRPVSSDIEIAYYNHFTSVFS